jgi:hypothetical protein
MSEIRLGSGGELLTENVVEGFSLGFKRTIRTAA